MEHRHSNATLSMRLIGLSACSRHSSARLRYLSVACAALVEAIDSAPTFVDWFGGKPAGHTLEGQSLTPWLRGREPVQWRKVVVSEHDYAMQEARRAQPISRSRVFMATVVRNISTRQAFGRRCLI
jgi:hypothetical protein